MNSASCEGAQGVSDTFASALWALNTMLNFAAAGVDGVNVHMLPGSNYELFTVSRSASGAWQAFVHPEYYGLSCSPRRSRRGPAAAGERTASGAGKVWATRGRRRRRAGDAHQPGHAAEHDVQVRSPAPRPWVARDAPGAERQRHRRRRRSADSLFGDETPTGTLPAAAGDAAGAARRRRLHGVARRRQRGAADDPAVPPAAGGGGSGTRAGGGPGLAPVRPRSCAVPGTSRGRACPGSPGTDSSSSLEAARIASGEPKSASSARLRAGPTPGRSSSTEAVIARSRRMRWCVMANRWASSRTRCSSCSSGVSWASTQRRRPSRDEHLLDPLGQ